MDWLDENELIKRIGVHSFRGEDVSKRKCILPLSYTRLQLKFLPIVSQKSDINENPVTD